MKDQPAQRQARCLIADLGGHISANFKELLIAVSQDGVGVRTIAAKTFCATTNEVNVNECAAVLSHKVGHWPSPPS
jgi:hypothetical protein